MTICVNEEPPLAEVEPGHHMRCHIPIEELRRLQVDAARPGSGRRLIVGLQRARLTALAVLCTGATGLAAAMPAHADRIGDTRAQAERAWAQIQSDGERLEQVVERANGAHLRLIRTERRIRNNQTILSATRVNLAHSKQALSASLISAYKSPMPDPLQAALSARNFGEVLEQFTLLDRTNSYNASMLRAIRVYKGEILRRQRLLARERTRAAGHRHRAGLAARTHPQLGRGREAALCRIARGGASPARSSAATPSSRLRAARPHGRRRLTARRHRSPSTTSAA